MTEKEQEDLRQLYLRRAKKEITEGDLAVAGRALQMVRHLAVGSAEGEAAAD